MAERDISSRINRYFAKVGKMPDEMPVSSDEYEELKDEGLLDGDKYDGVTLIIDDD